MIFPAIFGGENIEKNNRTSPDNAFLLPEFQPEMGRTLAVKQIFVYFQNLNLRILIENLRRGLVTRGNWSFADDLCPVAHGMPSGHVVGTLRYLSQAVDLPRACHLAAQEMGMPPRFLERFVLTWDQGTLSEQWLLDQLEAIWAERLADAAAVQAVVAGALLAPPGGAP